MKALDKVFDTQVITLLVINFISLEAKKIFIWRRKETDKKDGIKVTIVTEENPTEFIKVKVNGTLNDVISYKLWFNWFWKFVCKFWQISGNYNSKELSLKADGIKFH